MNLNNTISDQVLLTNEGEAYVKMVKRMKTKGDTARAREKLVTHILKMRVNGYWTENLERDAGLI